MATTTKPPEPCKIFKRAFDQSIAFESDLVKIQEPIKDWYLITDGEIESQITRDDKEMLIKAVFVYKAFDSKTLLLEVTEHALKVLIFSKLQREWDELNWGSSGWFGKPVLKEFNLEKVEFKLTIERNTEKGVLNKNSF